MAESVIPPEAAPTAPRSNGKGLPCDGDGESEDPNFAITVDRSAIGVAPVDLERGGSAPDIKKKVDSSEENRGR
jgi:hypothetical protein